MGIRDLIATLGWGLRSITSIILLGIMLFMGVIWVDIWNSGNFLPILFVSLIIAVIFYISFIFILDCLLKLCDFVIEKDKEYVRKKQLHSK